MASSFPPAPDRPNDRAHAGTPARALLRRVASRLLVLAVILALLLGVFAAVHMNSTSTPMSATVTGSAHPQHSQGAGVQATNPAPAAPDFTLTLLSGTAFHLAAQRGHVVVLYFMATGCAGCEPGSADLAQTMLSVKPQGAIALALDEIGTDHPADLQDFIQSAGIPASAPIQWGIDTTGAIANAYRVQALETTIVIDPRGQVAYRSDGSVPPAQLTQIVRSLA
jgi:peroxiredoxin